MLQLQIHSAVRESASAGRCLIHIGMPKTGTSTLQRSLFAHHSEIHYLGKFGKGTNFPEPAVDAFVDLLEKLDRSVSTEIVTSLRNHVDRVQAGGKLVVFSQEAYTVGSDSQRRDEARRFRAAFGAAQVLITLREPVAFMEALYFQQLKGFNLGRRTDGNIIKVFGPPPRYFSFDEWINAIENRRGIEEFGHLNIADTADIYAGEFGRDNVLILPFEKLKRDSEAFFRELSQLIGIDADETVSLCRGKIENERWDVEAIRRLQNLCRSESSRAVHHPDLDKRKMMQELGVGKFAESNRSPKATAEISDHIRKRILDVARPQCDRLVRDWNLPLAEYGYPVTSTTETLNRAA